MIWIRIQPTIYIYLHYLYRKLEKLAETRANLLPHLFSSFSPPWLSFGVTMQYQCTLFVGVIPAWNLRSLGHLMNWFNLLCFDIFFSMSYNIKISVSGVSKIHSGTQRFHDFCTIESIFVIFHQKCNLNRKWKS